MTHLTMTVLPQLGIDLFQESHITGMDLKHLSHSSTELVTYSLVKKVCTANHFIIQIKQESIEHIQCASVSFPSQYQHNLQY